MTSKPNNTIFLLLIFLAGFFILSQNLSILSFEFRNEEIYNFKTSRQIFQSGNFLNPAYEINPSNKNPIFFYWLTFLFYKVFGAEWVSARLISEFFGALTLALSWLIAKEMFSDRKKAALSAVVLLTGKLFFRHGRVAVADMALNFFLVAAFYFIYKFIRNPREKSCLTLVFLCGGLGFLTDGFPAIGVPLLSFFIYTRFTKKNNLWGQLSLSPTALILLALAGPWIIYMNNIQGAAYLEGLWANPFVNPPAIFGKNLTTSLLHFISYGLPWFPFLIPAVPLSLKRIKENHSDKGPLLFLLVWFFTVFFSFSVFTALLQQRILILTTPFAILVSYFFLEEFDVDPGFQKAIVFFKRYLIIFALSLGTFVFSFVVFLLAGTSKIFLPLVLLLYAGAIFSIRKFKEPLTAPLALGLLLITIFSQAPALQKSGLLPHTTIAKMVETIRKDYDDTTLIGAGKNGVPESIIQGFFDRKITDQFQIPDAEKEIELDRVLSHKGKVYYFMMAKDYERFIRNKREDKVAVIQEEDIVRKKIRLNGKFFLGILLWNADTVRSFLIDKIYLLKKIPGLSEPGLPIYLLKN